MSKAPYITGRGTYAKGSWITWSDGAVECMGTVGVSNGFATVTYPIALPILSRMISIAERLAEDAGSSNQLHVSMIIDESVTNTGFQARCQRFDGTISNFSFSWRVYCPPA